MKNKGYVYLIGAGPGDAGLITSKGMALIKQCDVVIYDRLASKELLGLTKKDCIKINVGKQVGNHSVCQEEINEILVREGSKPQIVVRLKGGDPFVFGRGGEEVEALRNAKIPYSLVPGLTSCISVPELAGIPVTHRGISQSFHVITGHTADSGTKLTDNYKQLAALDGTLVFLMGIANIKEIMDSLIINGKAKKTPAAVISKGGMPGQRIVKGTIENIADVVKREDIKAPAVIVVGEVAEFDLVCKEDKPLCQVKIGLTGTRQFVGKLTDRLEREGAICFDLCSSSVVKVQSAQLEQAIKHIASYSWLVFTSGNAVRLFMEQLREQEVDLRALACLKIAVIGKGTMEALSQFGIYADYMPKTYTTKALAELLCNEVKGGRVLIPRAKSGSKELSERLRTAGIEFDDIKIYSVENDEEVRNEKLSEITSLDYITFGSSEGVKGFFHNLNKDEYSFLKDVQYVCIGEVTKETLSGYVEKESITVNTYTAEGIEKAIIHHKKGE